LRRLLDQLDDLRRARAKIVERARRAAEMDDIQPRILQHAADAVKEQWADADPASFAQVIDAELAKYDAYQDDLKQNREKQEALLARIEEQNGKFLESRKADPSIKDREATLRDLDLAYQEYQDITRHLEEGLKFYNDFAEQGARLKAETQAWVNERRDSVKWLMDSLDPVDDPDEDINHQKSCAPDSIPTITEPARVVPEALEPSAPKAGKKAEATIEPLAPAATPFDSTQPSNPLLTPTTPSKKPPLRLPNPNSGAWQSTELPPAIRPPSSTRKTRAKDNA